MTVERFLTLEWGARPNCAGCGIGKLTGETNAAVDLIFGYTGKQLDDATGLQHNLFRWYDSELGQWLSEDPLGFEAGDENLRRYVGNEALSKVDSQGLQEQLTPTPLIQIYYPNAPLNVLNWQPPISQPFSYPAIQIIPEKELQQYLEYLTTPQAKPSLGTFKSESEGLALLNELQKELLKNARKSSFVQDPLDELKTYLKSKLLLNADPPKLHPLYPPFMEPPKPHKKVIITPHLPKFKLNEGGVGVGGGMEFKW